MTTANQHRNPSMHWSKITYDLLAEAVARTALTMNPPMSRTYRANQWQARQREER